MTKLPFILVVFPALIALLSSCAKKFDQGDGDKGIQAPRNQTSVDPDIQRFFEAQKATCEGECHPAVAKLIVFERGKIEYCTATLIDEDLLVTSSNCLSRNLKLPNVSCVNSVYAVFPQAAGAPAQGAMCDKVVNSTIVDEEGDPALWRSDFAFIKLRTPLHKRRPMRISREGMSFGSPVEMWKMDYLNDSLGSLEKDECNPLFNSYVNPFAQNSSSPMIPVSDCVFNEGNLGAPLVNDRGELVAVTSSKMDRSLSSYVVDHDVMVEKMAPIQHTSNLACADVPLASERGYAPNLECFKKIDYARLDRHRSRILNSPEVHRENMVKIEKELEVPNEYFLWDVSFHSNKKGNTLEAHYTRPKCYIGMDAWISEFSWTRWGYLRVSSYASVDVSHTKYILKTKLNRLFKAVSAVEKGESKVYQVEFNPAGAYFDKSTDVTVTSRLLGSNTNKSFTDITADCGE